MRKESGIYQIRNLKNNKVYIGSSCSLYYRKNQHFRLLRLNQHSNSHLQRSWNKYGKDNFKFEVLERGTKKDRLFNRERCWIKGKNSLDEKYGYNKSLPEDTGSYRPSEDTREIKRRKGFYQHNLDATEQDYQKWKQQKNYEKTRPKKKSSLCQRVYCFNYKSGGLYKIYESIGEAARDFNISDKIVSRICNSKNLSSYKSFTFVKEKDFNITLNYKKVYKKKKG